MRGCIWRGKANTEQLLDEHVVLQTASFNLEFLLVQSHFLGCFYRVLLACVESIPHHGNTRGHIGRGILLWCLHKATCMTTWLYSIHWNRLRESHSWISSTFTEHFGLGMGIKWLHLTSPVSSLYFCIPFLLPCISTPRPPRQSWLCTLWRCKVCCSW